MSKAAKRLLAGLLSLCMICAMAPMAFAAGATYEYSYELDSTIYQKGDIITVKLVLDQKNATGGFDLYSFTVDVGFDPHYLSFEGGTPANNQFHIDSAASNYNVNYDQLRVTWHGLSSFISCPDHTELATLKFKALDDVPATPLISLTKMLSVEGGHSKDADVAENGVITIGNPAKPTYAVKFERGNAAVTGDDPVYTDKTEGTTVSLPENPYIWTDHSFIGWKCSADEQIYQPNATYKMPAKAVTFTAQWQADKYDVVFAGGADTTGAAPNATQWKYGDSVSMYSKGTLAKSGYTFVGWSYGGKTYKTGEPFTLSDRSVTNVTFTAVWEENKTSGGGGAVTTTYPVNVTSPANGTVSADKKTAAAGDSVTVSVTPANGYKVGTVTVTDKNGKTVSTTVNNGKYTFKMPSSAVTVNVTFTKDGGQSGGNVSDCPKDATCPIEPFTDTENTKWWHDGIHYCVENGLMNGVSGSRFAPNGTTTRAMIVTILWRMEGSPSVSNTLSFKDVPSGKWYTEAIRWAQSTGVVTGYNADKFGPDDNITREQLAAILYRYADSHKIDVTARNTLSQYSDAAQVSGWALDSIKWANAVGMVNGRTASQLAPKASATRAEAASMIQRFCQNILHWSK